MKRYFVAAAAVLTLAISSVDAQALEIVNEDAENHMVLISSESSEKEVEVAANGTATDDCSPCVVQVGEGEPIEVEGDAVVVIKDGAPSLRE